MNEFNELYESIMNEAPINEDISYDIDEIEKRIAKIIKAIKSKDSNSIDQRSLDNNTDGEILAMVLKPIIQGAAMKLKDAKGYRKSLKGSL